MKIRSLQDELPTDDSWSKLHKLYQDGDHYTVNIWPKSLSYPLPRVAEPDSYANKLRVRFYVVHRDCNPCNHNVIQSHKDLVYRDHNPCNQSDKEVKAHDPLECMLRDNQNIRKRRLIDYTTEGEISTSQKDQSSMLYSKKATLSCKHRVYFNIQKWIFSLKKSIRSYVMDCIISPLLSLSMWSLLILIIIWFTVEHQTYNLLMRTSQVLSQFTHQLQRC